MGSEATMAQRGRVFQPTYKDKVTGETKIANRWYIQYSVGGKQVKQSTEAKTEQEAGVILAARLLEIYNNNPRPESRELCYADIRSDLLRYFRINKMPSLEILADGTESAKGLKKLDDFFGYPATRGFRVAAFDNQKWESEFIEARRLEGVSDATISNAAKLLVRMFTLAVENGKISFAPRITTPSRPTARKVYLSKEQFDATIGPNGMDARFRPVLMFLFYQGVRLTETFNLKWTQLDLEHEIFFPNAGENKTGNDEPKALQKEVAKALRGIKRGEYVFEDVRSEGGNVAKKFEKGFRAAMLKLRFGTPKWQCSQCRAEKDAPKPEGNEPAIACSSSSCKGKRIPMQYHYVGPTPHCLRASTVVYYRESGISDAEIMSITGHTSTKSFLGYSRTRVETVKARMDQADVQRKKRAA
jgi:integrase